MRDLTVTLVQSELVWEDAEANRQRFSDILARLPKTDLVVLPEMFTTGFTMHPEGLAEPTSGATCRWLCDRAAEVDAVVCGSVATEEDGRFYNRFFWAEPDGSVTTYDKRHLFRMADEHLHYAPGEARCVINWRGWRVLPLICYDLRFPVWSRNRDDYDLALYVANWPAARRHQWCTLLPARAIENLCYVVGVNRVGTDGNGVAYSGDSMALEMRGEVLVNCSQNAMVETVQLSATELLAYRERFPAHRDADEFVLS